MLLRSRLCDGALIAQPVLTTLVAPDWMLPLAVHAQTTSVTAAYDMNEGTGATTTDWSGNGITRTLQAATWTNLGKYGRALSFTGSSSYSYANVGNRTLVPGTARLNWSASILATGDSPDDSQIIARSNNNYGWRLKTSPDTGRCTSASAVSPRHPLRFRPMAPLAAASRQYGGMIIRHGRKNKNEIRLLSHPSFRFRAGNFFAAIVQCCVQLPLPVKC